MVVPNVNPAVPPVTVAPTVTLRVTLPMLSEPIVWLTPLPLVARSETMVAPPINCCGVWIAATVSGQIQCAAD